MISLPGLTANIAAGISDTGDVANRVSSGNVSFDGRNPFASQGVFSSDPWQTAALILGGIAIVAAGVWYYKHRRR